MVKTNCLRYLRSIMGGLPRRLAVMSGATDADVASLCLPSR